MVSGKRPWQTGSVAISGGDLAWHRTGGSGPVLVLAHGLTDNGLCWSRFAAAMEDDFDLVMLDARGHGASSRILPGGASDPGRDLAEAIAGLGLHAPAMIGHSVGARAAAACAATYPESAAMLVLEDPPLLPPPSEQALAEWRARFRAQVIEASMLSDGDLAARGRAQGNDWHPDDFPAWVQSKRQVDPAAWPVFTAPWQHDIAALTAPTLLLYGEVERGGLVTPDIAQAAMQLNPRLRAVQISRAGHNIRRENLAAVLTAVRAFLEGSTISREPGW